MDTNDQAIALLREIRDNQQKQMDAYEARATESIAIQQDAVGRQRLAIKIYVRALVVGGVIVAALLVLLVYLLRLL